MGRNLKLHRLTHLSWSDESQLTSGSCWKMTTRPPLSPVASSSPEWLNSTVDMMSAVNNSVIRMTSNGALVLLQDICVNLRCVGKDSLCEGFTFSQWWRTFSQRLSFKVSLSFRGESSYSLRGEAKVKTRLYSVCSIGLSTLKLKMIRNSRLLIDNCSHWIRNAAICTDYRPTLFRQDILSYGTSCCSSHKGPDTVWLHRNSHIKQKADWRRFQSSYCYVLTQGQTQIYSWAQAKNTANICIRNVM